MALITCPECNKQISETAKSCPHCGYLLTDQNAPEFQPVSTKIGELQQNASKGIIFIILGALISFLGLIFFFVFFVFGIIILFSGAMLIVAGIGQLMGVQNANCPHCGRNMTLNKNKTSFKCPTCKKRSARNGDFLEKV